MILTSTLKNKTLIPKFFKNLSFDKIKDDIFGKKYELSIVLVGKKRGKTLNNKYRNKNYATDVLSFGLSKTSGEICLTPSVAQIKAKKFEMTFGNYLLFLVIHASLHLKGMEHGSRMESYEQRYYSRYRRRHL